MDWLMQHFELILTVAVAVCFVFYMIDYFSYRKERVQLYKIFKNAQEGEIERNAYLYRLTALNQKSLSAKEQKLSSKIRKKLVSNEKLFPYELYWLRNPVYRKEKFIEFFADMFWILFIVWFARSFLYEPFKIPSASMEPTLEAGDFILTNKYTYGVRLPVTHRKIFNVNEVQRGDILVFRYPLHPSINYIKRVVGIPGDKVITKSGRIWINDVEQQTTEIARNNSYIIYEEQFGDKKHLTQSNKNEDSRNVKYSEHIIPDGKYLVLGDNRDNSEDGRYWGFVSDEHIVGKAFYIWMNSNCILGKGRCERIGTILK